MTPSTAQKVETLPPAQWARVLNRDWVQELGPGCSDFFLQWTKKTVVVRKGAWSCSEATAKLPKSLSRGGCYDYDYYYYYYYHYYYYH